MVAREQKEVIRLIKKYDLYSLFKKNVTSYVQNFRNNKITEIEFMREYSAISILEWFGYISGHTNLKYEIYNLDKEEIIKI